MVTNGSDGAVSDLWTSAVAGALARDWNAFVYDGPGQQSMLFERETCFRPDWEAVLTPVIDVLAAREDVDAHRMTGYGISQAGYWLPRALAFEHRLLAAVVDPGVVDVSTSWMGRLSMGMRESLDSGGRERFNRDMGLAAKIPSLGRTLAFRGRPYEHTDWFDLQHLDHGGVLRWAGPTAGRRQRLLTGRSPGDAVAGEATASAGGRAGVLAADRHGC